MNTLNQRNRSVAEYIQEWEKLSVLCEVTDTDEMRVEKFLAGLKDEIRRKLITIHNLTLQLACNMALTIEHNVVKKKTSFNTNYNRTPRIAPPKPMSSPAQPLRKDHQEPGTKGKSVVPIKDVVCFKCHGHGHYRDSCPNARAFTTQEWQDLRGDTKPRMMLVSINGVEEESWPSVGEEEPEGTYRVNEAGRLERYESSADC